MEPRVILFLTTAILFICFPTLSLVLSVLMVQSSKDCKKRVKRFWLVFGILFGTLYILAAVAIFVYVIRRLLISWTWDRWLPWLLVIIGSYLSLIVSTVVQYKIEGGLMTPGTAALVGLSVSAFSLLITILIDINVLTDFVRRMKASYARYKANKARKCIQWDK